MRITPAHLVSGLILVAGMAIQAGLQAQTAQTRAKVPTVFPGYQPKAVMKGAFDLLGTDALSDLGDEWATSFRKFHPESNLVFKSKLTKDAVTSFVEGANQLIITAREFTSDETKAFQAKFGYMPMRIPVCLDANIIFVHKSNPLSSISMEQLDAIYSKSRLGGAKAAALVWGDLGLRGEWAKMPIRAYARAAGTATRSSFGEKVLLNGEYRDGILDRDDASGLAEAVMTDPSAIAFGTMSSWYFANKILPVVPYHTDGSRFPNQENVTTSKYPMPRLYYAYLNRAPGLPLPASVHEVIHFILSQEGQGAVADSGLLPGPSEFITIALKRLSR